MGNVLVVIVILVVIVAVVHRLRHHGDGIIARRGMSIGADLGAMADARRVRIRMLSQEGPDRVRVILTPETGPDESELDLVVSLSEAEFGCGLLREWFRSDNLLALVIPPDSRLVRLRSIDDLQHLTLRLADKA